MRHPVLVMVLPFIPVVMPKSLVEEMFATVVHTDVTSRQVTSFFGRWLGRLKRRMVRLDLSYSAWNGLLLLCLFLISCPCFFSVS